MKLFLLTFISLIISFTKTSGQQNYMKNQEKQIKEKISSELNYDNSDKQKLLEFLKPTIGVNTTASLDDDLKIGQSKIGGKPDLPPNFQWPTYNNEPLSFCAQYNCTELAKFDFELKLPKNGILFIFIYIDQSHPGFLSNKTSYKVIYEESTGNLKRTDFPPNYFSDGIFKTAKIDFFEHYTFPTADNYKVKFLNDKNEEFSALYQEISFIIDNITGHEMDNYHQILGEAQSVQPCVLRYFASNELEIKSYDELLANEKKIDELQKEFEILIQLDTNDSNTDLSKYGGSMVIYFGIRPQDLKVRQFDKAVMAFQ